MERCSLELAIWDFFWVRPFLVDCFWVRRFWRDFFRVDKKCAYLRVLNFIQLYLFSFIKRENAIRHLQQSVLFLKSTGIYMAMLLTLLGAIITQNKRKTIVYFTQSFHIDRECFTART